LTRPLFFFFVFCFRQLFLFYFCLCSLYLLSHHLHSHSCSCIISLFSMLCTFINTYHVSFSLLSIFLIVRVICLSVLYPKTLIFPQIAGHSARSHTLLFLSYFFYSLSSHNRITKFTYQQYIKHLYTSLIIYTAALLRYIPQQDPSRKLTPSSNQGRAHPKYNGG
jgi:hypothetical protein